MGFRRIEKVFVLGVVLAIVGIIAVVTGIVLWSSKHEVEIMGRLGVVIDAGGSSTKLSIFEEKKGRAFSEIRGFLCEENGISSYTANLTELEIKLADCLRKAESFLPAERRTSVSLYLGATGGMRMLGKRDSAAYNKVIQSVQKVLNESSMKLKQANVLSGKNEGIYAWVTLNYLYNKLKSKSERTQSLEMGSTSAQIAFIPKEEVTGLHNEIQKVKVFGDEYTLYSHSYLCFGRNEFERRYYASITVDSGYKSIVDDPCHFRGDVVKRKSEYLWNEPCSTGHFAENVLGKSFVGPANREFEYKGTSDPTKCFEALRKLIVKTNCGYSHCGVNKVKQPLPNGFYTAFAALYYPVDFMGLADDISAKGYLDATTDLCGKELAQVRKMPKFSEKYSKGYCLSAAYSYLLLTRGLGLNESDWNVQFKSNINGQKISWRLGLQILHEDSMSQPITESKRRYKKALYNALLAAGTMTFFMGILCLAVWLTIKIREQELLGSRFVKDDGKMSAAGSVEATNKTAEKSV